MMSDEHHIEYCPGVCLGGIMMIGKCSINSKFNPESVPLLEGGRLSKYVVNRGYIN